MQFLFSNALASGTLYTSLLKTPPLVTLVLGSPLSSSVRGMGGLTNYPKALICDVGSFGGKISAKKWYLTFGGGRRINCEWCLRSYTATWRITAGRGSKVEHWAAMKQD